MDIFRKINVSDQYFTLFLIFLAYYLETKRVFSNFAVKWEG